MTLRKRPFKNIVGKRENAGNQHFLLFPQCFLKGLFLRVEKSGLHGKGIILDGHSKLNRLPDDKILEWSKLKQMADDILKCI